jgi:uncharacterized protein (UPF0210 family)
MRIRAITLFVDYYRYGSDLLSIARLFYNESIKSSLSHGINVWTLRIALSPVRVEALMDVASSVKSIPEEISYIAIPLEGLGVDDVDTIIDLLTNTSRIFLSIHGGEREYSLFIRMLMKLSSNPQLCTRIAFAIDKPMLTPYFPIASSPEGGFGVASALLYVNDLLNAQDLTRKINDVFLKAYSLVNEVSLKLNAECYGVDLSLSPWMEESVAVLIERIKGKPFNECGTYKAIFNLNCLIKAVSSQPGCVGFNEVMLPYAEDSRLMSLGEMGLLNVYDLISLASVCVAGLDMVVVPYEGLEDMLWDTYAVLKSKNKPSGVRVIPVRANPGDRVNLGRFGEVPVMMVRNTAGRCCPC